MMSPQRQNPHVMSRALSTRKPEWEDQAVFETLLQAPVFVSEAAFTARLSEIKYSSEDHCFDKDLRICT